MAQHDYNIANSDGANVRADINNVLAAIVSQNSGATEPSTTFAYQWWADTTSGNLKIRNAANSGWITVAPLNATHLTSSDIGTTVQGYDADTAKLDAGQGWPAVQYADTLALTHNTSWGGSLATGKQHLTVDVNGSSFTIANPSSQVNKTVYLVYITYTTSHGVSWGAGFKGVSAISTTNTAGAKDAFLFRSNGSQMELLGYNLNIGA